MIKFHFSVQSYKKILIIAKKIVYLHHESIIMSRNFHFFRVFAVFGSLLVSISSAALNMTTLSDSLTVYANENSKVGIVTVKRVRTSGRTARIYTCKTLSSLSLSPQELKDLRKKVSQWVLEHDKGEVLIYSDGYELGELLTMRFKSVPRMHTLSAVPPLVQNADRPFTPDHGMQGRHIALWGSHGWYYNNQLDRWLWQRAKLWTTVEDLYTSSYTMPYLVPMLENAGAVVIQPRERDTQTATVIVDTAAMREQDGQTVAEVRVPVQGEYAVYLWYTPNKQAQSRTDVTVHHLDRTTRYQVNMQMGAGTWVYIGKHAFAPEQTAVVSIHAPKEYIKAVRLGGGIDTLCGAPRWVEGASAYLPFAGIPDSIIDHTEGENTYINDFACRGKWVNYLLGGSPLAPKNEGLRIPVDLSMAFHSDAGIRGGDTIIGTLMIYTNKDDDNLRELPLGDTRLHCRYLGDYVQTQIVEDMHALYTLGWTRRGLKNSGYAEARHPKVPSFLLELLSHQNMGDMRYGLDPKVKFTISRAIYKGMLKYLCTARGEKYVVQPLPVENVGVYAIRHTAGKDSLRISWQAQNDPLEPTAKPAYYVLYTRETRMLHGRMTTGDWSNGKRVEKMHATLPAERGVRYDVKIVAGNAGGISMPSAIYCAYIAPEDKGSVLIVNAFDRVDAPTFVSDSLYAGIALQSYAVADGYDISFIGEQYDYLRSSEWQSDDNCGWGACYSDKQFELTAGNTHDYPLQHGAILAAMGWSYSSCAAGALPDSTRLAAYTLTDVILGKQRTTVPYAPEHRTDTMYQAFTPTLRSALKSYTRQGGALLISGMYLASEAAATKDADFVSGVLRCRLRGDHATRNGHVLFDASKLPAAHGELFPSAQIVMQPDPEIICCENPEGVMPCNGAEAVARYADSGMSAGIAYKGDYRLLAFPFMLESTKHFDSLYQRCIRYLTAQAE